VSWQRPTACVFVTLVVWVWLSAPSAAQPVVRVIATGGTISNHTKGRLSATALVASVPELASVARVETETFASVSSLELSLAEWSVISRRVSEVLASGTTAGVVITCGSDTLEELAWFLDLTVASDRPVVVTGSMRRPSDPKPDGPRNLADAVRVAADAASRGRGALVVMAGAILRARDATKLATSGIDAFGTLNGGPAGQVIDGRVRYTRDSSRPRGQTFANAVLPRVDIVLTYQQAPGDLIDASVRGGAKGLVIASAGTGALTAAQLDAVAGAMRTGLPVVVASRVPRADMLTSDVPRGTIAAGTLSPVKARILLMLALARGDSNQAIAEVFAKY
jgi:L-asparaginase